MRYLPKTSKLMASALVVALAGGLVDASGSGASLVSRSSSLSTSTVNVVGYSVVGPAFRAAEAAFKLTTAGRNVTFTNSFGASDTVTQAVANGQSADLVNLSYSGNMSTLVSAGKVPSTWSGQELSVAGVNPSRKTQVNYSTPGMLTDSEVVFVVRNNNPLHIATWADLIKPGVHVVTPNPATSGSAKWNLLAAYEQAMNSPSAHAAQNYLKSLLSHTVAQPSSGSASLAAFLAGTGNVLLSYEDDAIAAINAGKAIQIVVPPETFIIENPAALTNTGINNPSAVAFYQYLFSPAGQNIFAGLGFRSVLVSVWNQTKGNFPSFLAPTQQDSMTSLHTSWTTIDPLLFSSSVRFPSGSTTYPNQGIVSYLEQFAGTAP